MRLKSVNPALPKDFLRTCLLLLLREEPTHGYDLLERTRALGFDGSDPGGLYRALRKLEQDALVRSAWEPSTAGPHRRIYDITRAGMEELHRRAKSLAAGQGPVEAFLSRYEEFVALRNRDREPAGAPPPEATTRASS
jgi:PadR family transcriptional regulator, regulatory protein PadR